MSQKSDIQIIYNTGKEYPNMFKVYVYKTPYAININAKIALKKSKHHDTDDSTTPERQALETDADRSVRRVRTTISDIILCNTFDYFATFTFDPKKSDRSNLSLSKLKMSQWLQSQKKSHSPDLKYLIVPEHHKKCNDCSIARIDCPHPDKIKPIHFHALLKNYNGMMKDSGKKSKGRSIYNITSYRGGFSTAVPIDQNTPAVANYVKKYITKNMPRFSGKKAYWCSNGLTRPVSLGYNTNILSRTSPLFRQPKYSNDAFDVYEVPKAFVSGTIQYNNSNLNTSPTSWSP